MKKPNEVKAWGIKDNKQKLIKLVRFNKEAAKYLCLDGETVVPVIIREVIDGKD